MQPIQTRFDGGEISGRISGRFDSELYKKALRQSRNFEPLPHGSLRMRAGTELNQALSGDAFTRLVQIRMSTGQDYLVELLDKKAHLYNLSGDLASVETVGLSELVTNGDFSEPNGSSWLGRNEVGDFAHNGTVNVSFNDHNGNPLNYATAYTSSGPGLGGVFYQRIVVPFNANVHITFKIYSPAGGGFFADMKVKISTSDPAGWADIWNNGGESFLYHANPAGQSANAHVFDAVPAADFTNADLGVAALTPGVYWISFQTAAGSGICIDNVSLLATYGVAQTEFPTPWGKEEVEAVQFCTETGRDRTIFVHPQHSPWFLLFGGQIGNWTFGNITFNNIPTAWGNAGSVNVPAGWNWQGITASLAQANWPACVEMHDGRVYYSGEPAQKNRIVASRSNSPDDFTVGSNPGDMLDFKIATKGAIRWIKSSRVLLVGTDLGQHSITGSKGTPLVGDVQAREESAFPAAAVQAIEAGTQALYVSSDLRRLRAIAFALQTNGWESKDVTFVAEHITADLIKELHHAWTPDSVNFCVLKSGKLAICAFEPTEQVIAWWVLELGSGATVLSASASQGPLGAYLWMAVQRPAGVYLERLRLTESEPIYYLDGYKPATSDVNGKISGYPHLEGLMARVISDGKVLGDFAVGNGGEIQLGADNAAIAVVAGLAFNAKGITLPKDTRAAKAQSPIIGVVLNNSAIPKINGKRPRELGVGANPQGLEKLITGKRDGANLGWSDEDTITIEQDLPYRTEVCAIYSITKVEGR